MEMKLQHHLLGLVYQVGALQAHLQVRTGIQQ
jgi:hypothetical protein